MTISTKDLFFNLDRSGPIPMYYQIAKRMREAIESGDLPSGGRIENELNSLASRGRQSGALSKNWSTRDWWCGAAASGHKWFEDGSLEISKFPVFTTT
jgi:hypothetical protein